MAAATCSMATDVKITSPDGRLQVDVNDNNGTPTYTVSYDGKTMMTPSALGLKTNIRDMV